MVNIIGLGYIGLPTALMFASHGVEVVGTDINESLISKLKEGQITFEEEGMSQLLSSAIRAGIKFSTDYQKTDMYIVAVPTPYDNVSKKIDPCFVTTAVAGVLEVCPKGAVIVIESTVSPGTIDRFVRPIIHAKGLRVGVDVHIVHAPERIIPGNMVYELEHNSRTVGADDAIVGQMVKDIYASFCKGEIVVTDIRTAEMTKVVENTFRDINIAFANELAKICRSDSMDVYEIIRIANKHPRVNILQPGPGVGGHCISVDPWFLVGDYPGLANIILAARKINDSMPEFVLERTREIMREKGITDVSRVGFYGLTYKENVDDVRESPTLQIVHLRDRSLGGTPLKIFDPWVRRDIVPGQYHDFDAFLNDVDLVVIMVGHSHIRENMHRLSGKVVLDTRKICDLPETYFL